MLDLINGLPVHPLVVHGVVVLLPLSVVGAVALAVRPSWRRSYGLLVLGCTALATLLIPVATSSGESLEKRVGDPGRHAELGDQLLWFALPLLLAVAALVYLDRRPTGTRAVSSGLAVLTVVVALANGVQVYRVGDSGAKATWSEEVSSDSGRP